MWLHVWILRLNWICPDGVFCLDTHVQFVESLVLNGCYSILLSPSWLLEVFTSSTCRQVVVTADHFICRSDPVRLVAVESVYVRCSYFSFSSVVNSNLVHGWIVHVNLISASSNL